LYSSDTSLCTWSTTSKSLNPVERMFSFRCAKYQFAKSVEKNRRTVDGDHEWTDRTMIKGKRGSKFSSFGTLDVRNRNRYQTYICIFNLCVHMILHVYTHIRCLFCVCVSIFVHRRFISSRQAQNGEARGGAGLCESTVRQISINQRFSFTHTPSSRLHRGLRMITSM
jgi:hypothetical protein